MRRGAWPILVLVVVAGLVGVAFARPGGGNTYSGGGGHSSGGGGGGGGGGGDGGGEILFELLYWTVRLTIMYPQVMLPIIGIGLGVVLYSKYQQSQNRDWDSGPPVPLERAVTLEEIRRLDDDFSQVVFEDFAYRLYATAHRARHSAEALANAVGPYVSEAARAQLTRIEPVDVPVRSTVVGAMRAVRVSVPESAVSALGPQRIVVVLELEANTTTDAATYFTVESWRLSRDAARPSRPPSSSRVFACPNCGAPWASTSTGTQVCASCGQAVDNGRFDWIVEDITVRSSDERPPTLTNEVPERGTDLPTYRAPGVDALWVHLEQTDPAITNEAFFARLHLIYTQLNTAWSNNDLSPARGLLTDGLYDSMQYWIGAYQAQGLRNHLVDMRLTHTALAKVTLDKYFHAVTVRIWGTGKDYVVNAVTGEHVRGSRHRERAYSEYWTLIRSAARRGAPVTQAACSNCGAPLDVTQSGECKYCNAHVTRGEFDWVLSKIEQDDSYRG